MKDRWFDILCYLGLGIRGRDYFDAINSGQGRGMDKKHLYDFKMALKVQGFSPLMMCMPQAQVAETC